MRQLVELHDMIDVFDALDTDVLAIAQREDDPTTMDRVRRLVGDRITVVADVDGVSTDVLPLFTSFVIDREGVLRSAIPGTKAARARTDVLVDEVARVAGVEAPAVTYADGRVRRDGDAADGAGDEVLRLRTAWSHDAFAPGATTRLIALPEIAEGWRVDAEDGEGTTAFALEVDVPDGLELVDGVVLPSAGRAHDAVLDGEVAGWTGDIPLRALTFRGTDALEPGGTLTVGLTVTWRAGDGTRRTEPRTERWELALPVVAPDAERGQLYGWEGW